MSQRSDRRASPVDRRGGGRLELSKKPPRRQGERRGSERAPRVLWIREPGVDAEFEPCNGELGDGGLSWTAPRYPASRRVEVQFQVAGAEDPFQLSAEVISVELEEDALQLRGIIRELPDGARRALDRLLRRERPLGALRVPAASDPD